jgi:putative acetyltransferase
MAEDQGRIVGFGQLCLTSGEVEAVYVHPNAARQGVGAQLLRRLEARAKEQGLTSLHLDASLNAVPFYTVAGFVPQREAKHQLKSGVEITCVVMTKTVTR